MVDPLWLMTYCAYRLWVKNTDPATWPPLNRALFVADSEASDHV